MNIIERIVRALSYPIGQLDGIAGCARCHGSYSFFKHHGTPFHSCTEEERIAYHRHIQDRMGVKYAIPSREEDTPCSDLFPLCETCWKELSPKDRLPYYRHLVFNVWKDRSHWDEIQVAVLAGK